MPRRKLSVTGDTPAILRKCDHRHETPTREYGYIMYNGYPAAVIYVSYPCGYRRVDAAGPQY